MNCAMTNLTDTVSRDAPANIDGLYLNLTQDPRFGHFVRIPERICRCLDYFRVAASRVAVRERLHSYYLFIGVVDDLIDSTQLEAGREILGYFDNGIPCFDQETMQSPARLAAEVLKCHIDGQTYSTALTELKQLYQAVVRERNSRTIRAYIEERRAVGRLTAKLSFLLIRPLFEADREDLCRFLEDVGEVGCLIDNPDHYKPLRCTECENSSKEALFLIGSDGCVMPLVSSRRSRDVGGSSPRYLAIGFVR